MLDKIKKFLKEVKMELAKVSWLSKRELAGSTIVVVVVSLLLAIFIGIVDKFLSVVMSFILQ
jgi:preprotein translocase subunit SecE